VGRRTRSLLAAAGIVTILGGRAAAQGSGPPAADAGAGPADAAPAGSGGKEELEVLGLDTKRGEFVPYLGGNAELWLLLRSSASKPIKINAPVFTALAIKGENNTRFQSRYRLEVLAQGNGRPATFPMDLGAHADLQLTLRIDQLDGTGEYAGRLSLAGTSRLPVEKELTLVLKEPWWIAFVFIVIGVFLSHWIRNYLGKLRPRLLTQRDLVGLRERLAAGPAVADDVAEARLAVLARVDETLERLALAEDVEAGELAALRAQVGLCLHLVAAAIVRSRLSPERGAAFAAPIDQSRAAAQQPPDTAAIEAAEAALRKAEDDMRTAAADEAKARVTAFRAVLDARRKQPQGMPVEALDEIARRLDEAGKALESGETAAARQLYDVARKRYAEAAAATLDAAVKQPGPTREMPPNAWDELRKRVADALAGVAGAADADAAVKAAGEAERIYAAGLIEGLLKVSQALRPEKRGVLEEVDAALAEARRALADLDVTGAMASYERARVAFAKWPAEAQMGDQKAAPKLAPLAPAANLPGGMPLVPPARHNPTGGVRAWIARRMRMNDRILLVVTLVIAGLTGVQALWATSTTWGGWNAHVLALLWGLGLHQISGVAFGGLESLQERIAGTRQP
jgi:hypothetical protein